MPPLASANECEDEIVVASVNTFLMHTADSCLKEPRARSVRLRFMLCTAGSNCGARLSKLPCYIHALDQPTCVLHLFCRAASADPALVVFRGY